MQSNFVWSLIGIYGSNDNTLQEDLWDELTTFMSLRDTPWCLGGDFNVARFPSERSSGGRLSLDLSKFYAFINSCNNLDPPLESARFTLSSYVEVPILSQIDMFNFFVDQEDHFQGIHQVVLPKITSDHVPILLHVGDVSGTRRPFKFENVWLEVEGFAVLVKDWRDELDVVGFPVSFCQKTEFFEMKLKEWNKYIFFWLKNDHYGGEVKAFG